MGCCSEVVSKDTDGRFAKFALRSDTPTYSSSSSVVVFLVVVFFVVVMSANLQVVREGCVLSATGNVILWEETQMHVGCVVCVFAEALQSISIKPTHSGVALAT